MTSALLNKVWEGDCLKLMQEISNQSVDMILADLPYATTANEWDKPIDFQMLWKQYKRILQPKGVIVLTSQGRFTAQLIESNPEWFKYKIVWIKSVATNYLNAKKQPLRKHEDICVFYKQQPIYHPQMGEGKPYIATRHSKPNNNYGIHTSTTSISCGARYPTDILSYNEDYIHINSAVAEGNIFHPTQKPVALGRYLIRTYTNPGQIVLDNACGSGSFLVASILEYRNFIGIEKNKNATQFRKHVDYIQICNRRIQEAYDSIKTDHF
jgi:DNA modification methylase